MSDCVCPTSSYDSAPACYDPTPVPFNPGPARYSYVHFPITTTASHSRYYIPPATEQQEAIRKRQEALNQARLEKKRRRKEKRAERKTKAEHSISIVRSKLFPKIHRYHR
jgi:hypothetical protein